MPRKTRASTTASCGAARGTFGALAVDSTDPTLDELLVTHDRAVQPVLIRNTGSDEMVIFKFFGPDVNPDVPMIGDEQN